MTLMQNYAQYDITFARGKGSYLYDETETAYLDCACGISVTNLGHIHPYITGKFMEQAEKLWHTSNLFPNKLPEKLAKRLSEAAFGGQMFFCNSGAEANEGAIKLAIKYNNNVYNGKKPRIITMVNGFHGRTYAAMSATAQEKIRKGFEPAASFFSYIPYNDTAAAEAELAKGDVCAVMLELYQGEAGVLPADPVFVKNLRELTHKYGALMIIDEIQTGYGRTGKLFAYSHFGIVPDIITMAKAMANGIPMGGIMAKPEIAALFTHGTHGSTFGANLLACAAADAVLDILLAEGFLDEVAVKGEKTQTMLKETLLQYGISVRGRGMLIGVELPSDNKTFIKNAMKEKILVIGGGTKSVRFYPPLNASMAELEEGVGKMAKAALATQHESGFFK
ncbi:MAG: acetylornithine/succinylornithine family transaminase [Deferribacteraceae bacterium]|jgi:predicted acetylornithine/succinylornithine family transaminase|nr:acetylornithine/succinylornithine family transaminase [Deferribacteraceae bacterium]